MEEPHRLSVSSNPVPDGVEFMLTKSSEEEPEHGVEGAAPPPPCEARSRSGGGCAREAVLGGEALHRPLRGGTARERAHTRTRHTRDSPPHTAAAI
jgi:hypothetical protein